MNKKFVLLSVFILIVVSLIVIGFLTTHKDHKLDSKKPIVYKINDYVQNGRPTELLLKESPTLWTGYTYRYDVVIEGTTYFIWVNNENRVVKFGPEANMQ